MTIKIILENVDSTIALFPSNDIKNLHFLTFWAFTFQNWEPNKIANGGEYNLLIRHEWGGSFSFRQTPLLIFIGLPFWFRSEVLRRSSWPVTSTGLLPRPSSWPTSKSAAHSLNWTSTALAPPTSQTSTSRTTPTTPDYSLGSPWLTDRRPHGAQRWICCSMTRSVGTATSPASAASGARETEDVSLPPPPPSSKSFE